MKKWLIILLACATLGVAIFLITKDDETPQPTTSVDQQNTANQASDMPLNQPGQPQQPASFDKNKYSVDQPSSIWVVANKQRPLSPKDYAPSDLVSVGGQRLRQEAANSLIKLIASAKANGLTIQPLSGYRSYSTQVSVYNNEVATSGQAVADTQSARPGHSEHQTGWAIDVGGGGCGIEDCFANTAEGKWIAANAYTYGFILRYPEGKQAITGYRYEPWHIRYVGEDLAAEMKKQNIQTLEEFFNLPAAPNY